MVPYLIQTEINFISLKSYWAFEGGYDRIGFSSNICEEIGTLCQTNPSFGLNTYFSGYDGQSTLPEPQLLVTDKTGK